MTDFMITMIIIDLIVTIFLHFDGKLDIERKIDEKFQDYFGDKIIHENINNDFKPI